MKVLVIDLDGTLCELGPQSLYLSAKPKWEMIHKVNDLYNNGWDVVVYTARGMNQFSGDLKKIEETYRTGTEEWLKKHAVKYTSLRFGKPAGDMYVDDKGKTFDEFLAIRPSTYR